MYPAFFMASDFQKLGPPGPLLERARRLYVLSPLFDPDPETTPYRVAFDHETLTGFYTLDLRQGECATLAVSHNGVVLAGVVGEATPRFWFKTAELKAALRSVDPTSRNLLQVLAHAEFISHWGRSFCFWKPTRARKWHAASEMFQETQTPGDHLGPCQHLIAPVEFMVEFAEHYTGNRSIARFIGRYLKESKPTLASFKPLKGLPSHVLAAVKERAGVVGLDFEERWVRYVE